MGTGNKWVKTYCFVACVFNWNCKYQTSWSTNGCSGFSLGGTLQGFISAEWYDMMIAVKLYACWTSPLNGSSAQFHILTNPDERTLVYNGGLDITAGMWMEEVCGWNVGLHASPACRDFLWFTLLCSGRCQDNFVKYIIAFASEAYLFTIQDHIPSQFNVMLGLQLK
jgi:hypothetical protein